MLYQNPSNNEVLFPFLTLFMRDPDNLVNIIHILSLQCLWKSKKNHTLFNSCDAFKLAAWVVLCASSHKVSFRRVSTRSLTTLLRISKPLRKPIRKSPVGFCQVLGIYRRKKKTEKLKNIGDISASTERVW